MKHGSNNLLRLGLVTAAIGAALGAPTTWAQQPNPDPLQQPGIPQQPAPIEQPGAPQAPDPSQLDVQPDAVLPDVSSARDAGVDQADIDRLSTENSQLSTFVEAVKAAGLADALTEGTRYTAFAPTNDAFEAMPDEGIEELLKPENHADLVALLRAHIVADDVDSDMAHRIPEALTIDGGSIQLHSEGDKLMIGEANAAEPNIELGSLRVYAIDSVLAMNSDGASVPAFDRETASRR
jgi:uncharacterized surface protein with fasciclin (FAS1) repeats